MATGYIGAPVQTDEELNKLRKIIADEKQKLKDLEEETSLVGVDKTAEINKQKLAIKQAQTAYDKRYREVVDIKPVTSDLEDKISAAELKVKKAQDKVNKLSKKGALLSEQFGRVPSVKPAKDVDLDKAKQQLTKAQENLKSLTAKKPIEEQKPEGIDYTKGVMGAGKPVSAKTNIPDVVSQGVVAAPAVAAGDGTTVYLGTSKPTVVGQGPKARMVTSVADVQTIDNVLNKLDVIGPEGDAFRQQVKTAFDNAGISYTNLTDLKIKFKKALDTTAGADTIKGNQSVWETIDYMAQNQLFGGTGTGPSAKELKNKREAVKLIATELGVNLTPEQVNAIGYEYANGDIDAITVKSRIAKQGEIDFRLGEAAKTIDGLKKQASDYGIAYNDDWYTKSAKDILQGVVDNDTITKQFKTDAKSRFPALAKQIDAGYTVQQIASPYVNSMYQILEHIVDINDNYIQQALTSLDKDGQPTTKPLWQFEQDLRKDPRWAYTKNAQESMMSASRKVLQDFGLAY